MLQIKLKKTAKSPELRNRWYLRLCWLCGHVNPRCFHSTRRCASTAWTAPTAQWS